MSKQPKILIALLIVIAIVIGAYIYFQSQSPQSARPSGFPPAVVAATEVSLEKWQPMLRSVGSLVAINGIDVSTEVNGIVSQIVFNSGQMVEQGQILIKLEDTVDLAAWDALVAEQRVAQVQYERAKDLLKKRVLSKSEHDEALARYEAAKARSKQQEAIVKRKIIRAPFSGLAGIRQVDVGQYIEAGEAMVSLQSLDPIFVDYTLPERYLTRIRAGQEVRIKLEAMPDQVFTGKVTAVNSGVDVGTRTLKIRATIENPQGVLRPGMFASVETITGDAEPVMTLPRTAISFNTYGNFVYVINKNDKGMLAVKRTPVETGDVRNGRVIVKGIDQGTQVVRTGLVKLRDGMPVKIDNQVPLNDAEISGE
jgi:membrane fusion protein (multidrug efflux system)